MVKKPTLADVEQYAVNRMKELERREHEYAKKGMFERADETRLLWGEMFRLIKYIKEGKTKP